MITPAQRVAFERDGFLVLPRLFDAGTCRALIARADALVRAAPLAELATVFSTRDQARHGDDYFLASGDRIAYFLEEEAVDRAGRLTRPKTCAINKIGHALHDLDPAFAPFSRRPELAAVAHGLGMTAPLLLQSMLIFKQPEIGGEVALHQDATFLYTEPVSVMGLWVALEDATLENGCMWALPGGHRAGLKRRFKRTNGGVAFEELDLTPFRDDPAGGEIPLEAPQGTVVVLHGLLPHRSGANRSQRSRLAYSIHLIEAGAHYPADNWLQRSQDMKLRGFA
jgi:phytanoyl-CoA hydroxylase